MGTISLQDQGIELEIALVMLFNITNMAQSCEIQVVKNYDILQWYMLAMSWHSETGDNGPGFARRA